MRVRVARSAIELIPKIGLCSRIRTRVIQYPKLVPNRARPHTENRDLLKHGRADRYRSFSRTLSPMLGFRPGADRIGDPWVIRTPAPGFVDQSLIRSTKGPLLAEPTGIEPVLLG